MKRTERIKLVTDLDNVDAMVYALCLKDALEERGIQIAQGDDKADLFVVFGGDGTMLRAVHKHGLKPTFFGVNCGHKGFLMNDGTVQVVAENIANNLFRVRRFPLLEIESESGWRAWAINDVYFNRITGQTAKINLKVNGVEIAERISGDGVVVSAALGSAGYFVPAGGSALHPLLPAIGLAPVVRNVPIQLIPMVFPINSELEITLLSPSEEVRGWYDGFELPNFRKIKVRGAKQYLKLAFLQGEDMTERMVRKIMQVQGG